MPEQNQRELAQQGDPKAIEAAINHSLKPRGITAEVMRDNGCLHVMMEGDQVPTNQSSLVTFVRNGMAKLNIESIYKLKVYGRKFGADLPAWEDEILLKSPPPGEMLVEELEIPSDTEPSSSVPLIDDDLDLDRQMEREFTMDLPMPMSDEEIDLDDDEIDLDDQPDFGDEDHHPEEDDDEDEDEILDDESGSRSKIFLFILLLLLLALAALAGLHLSGVYKLPFLGGGGSQSDIDPLPTETDTEILIDSESGETDQRDPPQTPAADPWREAVNTAINAANLAQSAQTRAEWNTVANEWGRAAELMQQVPQESENYSTAQEKVVEYSNNQQIALQRSQNAPN
jgi:hypothetical protein